MGWLVLVAAGVTLGGFVLGYMCGARDRARVWEEGPWVEL